jgi:hypothetical protein
VVNAFSTVAHPQDPTFLRRRQEQIDELLQLTPTQLDRQLKYMLQSQPIRDDHEMVKKIAGEMYTAPYIPQGVKGILDSTGGTTGSVLIRQDLEPTLYALFVKQFPAFERLAKGPANGLVHAATQITSPDSSSLGSTVVSELGSVGYVASTYNRVTFPVAVFATGRGISFKELAAVSQGGAPYDPSKTEMANGMVKLATDVQYYIMQGNASNNTGLATNEGGAQNVNGIDGFRGTLGSFQTFSGNNALQADISSMNMLESMQFISAKAANNGGRPTAAFLSMNAKQALDTEQQSNQRYITDTLEIIPGTRVNQVGWANGQLAVIPVPGNTIGTYNRTSDNQLVEDIYIIDESTVTVRWLYSENFTVLQLPAGFDNTLSQKYIIFGMYGLEIAAPLFCGKVRRLAS